ncbi:hypothetical protein BC829DRAFT_488718 [Chytridium lagenaria]|nr:hypothetical protein BC829DRAFT_488718 [Chytridium lagenaria]
MDDMAILVALYLEWATQGLHLLARRASISKTAMLADNAVKALESLRILRMSGVSGRRLASPGRVVKREDGEVERFGRLVWSLGLAFWGVLGARKGGWAGRRFVKGVVALSLPDAVNDGRVTVSFAPAF